MSVPGVGRASPEGLQGSALAWLLHGRQLPGEEALSELGNYLNGKPGETLADPFLDTRTLKEAP